MTENPVIGLFSLDEIDSAATDLLQTLADMEIPVELAILAACRIVTILGKSEDLDCACSNIDLLSEHPYTGSQGIQYDDSDEGDGEDENY